MASGANYFSGIDGKVTYQPSGSGGPVTLPVKTWSATAQAAALDSTNTMSAGFKNVTQGITSLEGELTLVWDGSSTANSPPNFVVGAYMSIELYPKSTLTVPITCPSAFIKSVKYNDPVEQILTVDISFDSDGSFTMPTGL